MSSLKALQELIVHFFVSLRWQDTLDLALVSLLFFRLFSFIKETRASHLLRGLLLLVLTYFIANNFLDLRILTSVLQNAATLVIVAIPVVFQPELRRALSEIGRRITVFGNKQLPGKSLFNIVNVLVDATQEMAENRTGALIVIERQHALDEYFKSGHVLDAETTKELLLTIFYPGTPMHDGAVVIRGNRLMAACVVLPSRDTLKSPAGIYWGMRHRAALGLSDVSDAACIVVSEETGSISLVEHAKIHRNLSEETLERKLLEIFQVPREEQAAEQAGFWERLSHKKPLPPKIAVALAWLRKFSDRVLFDLRFIAVILSLAWGLALGMGTGQTHTPTPLNLDQHTRVFILPVAQHPPTDHQEVRVEPQQVKLILTGRSEILKQVASHDIEVSVHLQDLKTPQQLLPLSVILPQDIELRELCPRLVKVSLTPPPLKPTPSP